MKWTANLLLAGLILAGCQRDLPRADAPSPRVVSFSPAITAMIFQMGLDDHLVGVTTYCDVPEDMGIPVVGSQLNIRAEPIVAVEPDVLLTQTAVERFETVQKLNDDLEVVYFKIETLTDIADAMAEIAIVLGQPKKGADAREQFLAGLETVRKRVAGKPRPRVIFVMGYHDPATAGTATFTNELIEVAGGLNAAAEKYDGWKSTGIESVLKLEPDVIVCQTKPDEADQARLYWQELTRSTNRTVRVYIVTDDRWTIPTARMADPIASEMADFIHPEPAGRIAP